MSEKLYTIEELGEYLGLTRESLAQLRYERKGPRWLKIGRQVRYRESAISSWIQEQEDLQATSAIRPLSGIAKVTYDKSMAAAGSGG